MSTADTKNPQVLIVDDEPRLQQLLARGVEQIGFTPLAVGSAKQALEILNDTPPQIVLLDLNMPGMSGMELFKRIRKKYPHIQVIILTAFGDLETAQQAIRLGVTEFLTKPYTLGNLEQALARAQRALIESDSNPSEPSPTPASGSIDSPTCPPSLEDVEKNHILEVLRQHQGDRKAAAETLNISLRTLYYRLATYRDQGEEG